MLDFNDLKQLINDEQKPTEKEQAIIDTEKAKANYYQEKANKERAQADNLNRQHQIKENKRQDIGFLIGVILALVGIFAQVIILIKIMF